ncbi:MAG TPA: primase-helicase zinc-binding domain-containing protein [Prosthecobacter sp.]|nr:primase-helicase zinc-binding domain-containing protein [Prosthecobacter sp.]
MSRFFDASDVLDAARGRWPRVLADLGVRADLLTGRHGPCPGCGGKDRFRFDDIEGNGSFVCSQGGAGLLAGNGVTLLMHVTGWEWKDAIEQLGRRLLPDSMRRGFHRAAGGGGAGDARPPIVEDLPPEPVREDESRVPVYDEAKLRAYVASVPPVTRQMLKRVSPLKVQHATASDFLDVLYGDRERVLVFTEFFSQGNFLHQVGSGSCRLSPDRGIKAVVSPLPTRGPEGVWYLCNPVDGRWQPSESRTRLAHLPAEMHGPPQRVVEHGKWGRRTWRNVTTFRYAVLESDCAPEDLWMRALVKLPVPIAAIYSSGGKSLHALVRVDAGSKPEWDLWVRGKGQGTHTRVASIMDLVCPLGADAAALTAVRLTRLPCCFREGVTVRGEGYKRYPEPRMQELIYLNPMSFQRKPEWRSILSRHGGAR